MKLVFQTFSIQYPYFLGLSLFCLLCHVIMVTKYIYGCQTVYSSYKDCRIFWYESSEGRQFPQSRYAQQTSTLKQGCHSDCVVGIVDVISGFRIGASHNGFLFLCFCKNKPSISIFQGDNLKQMKIFIYEILDTA